MPSAPASLRALVGLAAAAGGAGCTLAVPLDDLTGGEPEPEPRPRYVAAVLADAPVGYWRFGDRDTTEARDESAGGLAGEYQNGVALGVGGAIQGDQDGAARLDGEDDHVTFGDRFDFPGYAPFSFELWLRPDAVQSAGGVSVLAKQPNATDGHQLYYEPATSRVSILREIQDETNDGASAPIVPERFTHVVATFDGLDLRVFADALAVGKGPGKNALPDHAAAFMVGWSPGTDEYFAGVIDEVAVYDHALTAERVQAHYQAATEP